MPKNIAFFADGTWNGPGQDENNDGSPDPTNVFRLFDHLEGTDTAETKLLAEEQEQVASAADGSVTQISKYIHGVGDSRNAINRIFGGTFGAGVINRIVRGYTFLSRSYDVGDHIYIVGFSRGAYTARALAGMICSVGLLDKQKFNDLKDREQAYRLGMAAWTRYRERAGHKARFLEWVRGMADRSVSDAELLPDVQIRAVGVWDTVGSLGMPDYVLDSDLFRFTDTALNKKVKRGIHAVSIDERRADFTPTLWDPREGITQVWFAGAHADVGGGYAERHLSDIALLWLGEQLEKEGLRMKPNLAAALKPDPLGKGHTPWDELPWRRLPFVDRDIPDGAVLHPSVDTRRTGGNYGPASLTRFLGRRPQ